MKSYCIYIDDSGDPGLKETSSSFFVIAAVVLSSYENKEKLNEAVVEYRKGLGWSENMELKFHKTGKDAIRLAIRAIKNYDYEAYAIVMDKSKIDFRELAAAEQNAIFLHTIKELLLKIKIPNADIIIDGVRGPKYVKKARTYLRQHLKVASIPVHKISFEDSRKNSLIQLADLVAGSVARFANGKDDGKEYVRLFGNKLKKIFKN